MQKRKRILNALARSAEGRASPHRSGSFSGSSDDDISLSDSDASDNSGRRLKHRSKKHRSKKGKKRRKDKISKEMSAFGRYGVIRESDYHSKRAEFVKWAMDTKRIDTESLNRTEEMKLFADFAEDYNTGKVFAGLFATHHHVPSQARCRIQSTTTWMRIIRRRNRGRLRRRRRQWSRTTISMMKRRGEKRKRERNWKIINDVFKKLTTSSRQLKKPPL